MHAILSAKFMVIAIVSFTSYRIFVFIAGCEMTLLFETRRIMLNIIYIWCGWSKYKHSHLTKSFEMHSCCFLLFKMHDILVKYENSIARRINALHRKLIPFMQGKIELHHVIESVATSNNIGLSVVDTILNQWLLIFVSYKLVHESKMHTLFASMDLRQCEKLSALQ